ncbi:hypothetical protein [Brevundimonas sp.]|uniref:hypothetical protein n=1 Tax=Brevundimonas sp. TaxID=1871086 RepID=UPI002D41710A|nr:hypothetical protein [Brevundimonas sp.]HYC69362.1 hypothetical protein [Brevundimonas sp.]
MSWCDKLASVPTIGVKLSPSLVPGDFLLRALSPLITKSIGEDLSSLNMEEHSSFGLKFGTNDGFKYGIDPQKVSVGFAHRLRAIAVSGGPPVMEMLSRPMPFTELLPEVGMRLHDIVLAMPDISDRNLHRVGVVSTTHVDENDLPPGIVRFIEYQEKPWNEPLSHYSFQIAVSLTKSEKWIDKCIHTITKPDDPEKLMTLQFDWQREYADPKAIDDRQLSADLKHCSEAALEYFEELAEGVRFDA